jgi:hypothetical protein
LSGHSIRLAAKSHATLTDIYPRTILERDRVYHWPIPPTAGVSRGSTTSAAASRRPLTPVLGPLDAEQPVAENARQEPAGDLWFDKH